MNDKVVKWYEDPVYIKMSDCVEIQFRHNWKEGDYLVALQKYEQVDGDDWPIQDIAVGEINIIHNAWRMDDRGISPSDKAIWLPRQDQLQEMVELPRPKLVTEFYTFAVCSEVEGVLALNYYRSMEQLWLAFVMKEKYNKTWSEEEWL